MKKKYRIRGFVATSQYRGCGYDIDYLKFANSSDQAFDLAAMQMKEDFLEIKIPLKILSKIIKNSGVKVQEIKIDSNKKEIQKKLFL